MSVIFIAASWLNMALQWTLFFGHRLAFGQRLTTNRFNTCYMFCTMWNQRLVFYMFFLSWQCKLSSTTTTPENQGNANANAAHSETHNTYANHIRFLKHIYFIFAVNCRNSPRRHAVDTDHDHLIVQNFMHYTIMGNKCPCAKYMRRINLIKIVFCFFLSKSFT